VDGITPDIKFMTNYNEQEWIYRIALKITPGMGDITVRKLIDHFGSATEIYSKKPSELRQIKGISTRAVEGILSGSYQKVAEKHLQNLQKLDAQLLFYSDSEYPARLSQCPDSPVMLFYKGSSGLNARRMLGVVGTRNATLQGKKITEDIVKGLVKQGVTIVSGLAYGIDTMAHRSAVVNQLPTIAVLGHGLDTLYPQQNSALARKIVLNGGLITEFFPNTLPDRENFPRRNRIIAGLCDAIVVVEAASKGGALITADIANTYNRDVFAVPGRWGDEYAVGCNKLIKINKAALIQSADDIKYIMGWDNTCEKQSTQANLFGQLPEKEQKIYALLLKHGAAGIDFISHLTHISQGELSSLLLKMEFDGIIRILPGKLFAIS
jgi:DNA processing protein